MSQRSHYKSLLRSLGPGGCQDGKEALTFHQTQTLPLAVTQSVDNKKLCVKTIPPYSLASQRSRFCGRVPAQVFGVIRVKSIARWLRSSSKVHRHAASQEAWCRVTSPSRACRNQAGGLGDPRWRPCWVGSCEPNTMPSTQGRGRRWLWCQM